MRGFEPRRLLHSLNNSRPTLRANEKYANLANGGYPQSRIYAITPAAQVSTFTPYLSKK